ncbi:Gfo/Idh/MocA family oxidoreductase [Paraflavitalea sp. CAU 1676]|uniref:Gfo/Idh/MocA family protein n=1 Tax=Paraflavitalea sp. CAU 1676 TaxID=3032598 RepID=UPI0023DB611E|nr:Gfo/Idh/MocA family oxidoreductase [Paraflavitalea sp. CAU 1676]MDF2190283.1 Gfo/Idh/MocA family oxidoreductase [Paraflavitalea sp. CAU 1676]
METFTWGIIGPGNIATEFADDLEHLKGVHHRIGAVLSHHLDKAADFAEKENAPQYFDHLESFLTHAKVDAVYIATPHPLHHRETIACLQRKLPVLCEKPMAMNSRQVKEMVEAAEANNTFLMEAMWIRFLPSINKVLDLIDCDAIGKIISIKADLSYKAPEDPQSRYFDPSLGGGSLLDLGIYPIFLAHLLLGKPVTIQARSILSDKSIDKATIALFGYGNAAYASIESSLVTQTDRSATIYGERGRIHIASPWNEKPAEIKLESYDGESIQYPCEWPGRGLQFEAAEVYRCLHQHKLYSEQFCHSFSLDLATTLDAIREQTGIRYPADQPSKHAI